MKILKRTLKVVLIVLFFEVGSFLFLKFMDLDYNLNTNGSIALKLRSYLIAPNNSVIRPKYLPHKNLNYIHNPNYIENDIKQNNKFGWRGEAPSINKAEGVYRIVCLGGSKTYGFGVESNDCTYPKLLEKNFAQKYTTPKIEVINAGTEGASSFEEINHYLHKISYLKPDAVILNSGGNDAALLSLAGSKYSPDGFLAQKYYISVPTVNPKLRFFLNSYTISFLFLNFQSYGMYAKEEFTGGVFQRSIGENYTPWFDQEMDMSDLESYSFYNNFNTLTDLLLRDSVEVYILPFSLNERFFTNKTSQEYKSFLQLNTLNNDIMKAIALKKGLNWISLESEMLPEEAWLGDFCHLNCVGNQIQADFLSNKINIFK